MNVLIIGCGMVGAELAHTLDKHGHDVSIVDKDESSFDLLSEDFSGFTTLGVPIDQEILRRAGISTCDALCAVTDNDNMNVMAAQVASKVFGVPKVFARIRDVSKCRICESMGISTVCPTSLVVEAACTTLEDNIIDTDVLNIDNHRVTFNTINVPDSFIGLSPEKIEYEEGETFFAVIRNGGMKFNEKKGQLIFKAGDKLIFAKKS
ncbi:MAG: NAD-binding protein [Oscillospiraceae bacterium]|nr:NAD-binding protein [Oscillospiraceae bacterium]